MKTELSSWICQQQQLLLARALRIRTCSTSSWFAEQS